jgi:hypothetical protein
MHLAAACGHEPHSGRREGIVGPKADDKVEEAALVGRVEGAGNESVHGGEILLERHRQHPGHWINQHVLQVTLDASQRLRAISVQRQLNKCKTIPVTATWTYHLILFRKKYIKHDLPV